jgi:hypothetical protein
MTYSKSREDITETLRTKGNRIEKVTCVTQFFPNDGAFMQVIPINQYKSVGAILQPNLNIPVHKTWHLIPVIQIHDHSSSKPADYTSIKENLEEIIICCKSCLEAYKKTNDNSEYFGISCGNQDLWIANNFMEIFNSLQSQWDVECIGVDSNPNNCLINLRQRTQVVVKLDKITEENNKLKTNVNASIHKVETPFKNNKQDLDQTLDKDFKLPKIQSRPKEITRFCILGFVTTPLCMILALLPMSASVGTWYPSFLFLGSLLCFVSFVGMWMMKKWGVYTYTFVFTLGQIVLLSQGQFNFMSIIIPIAIIRIGFNNISKMS